MEDGRLTDSQKRLVPFDNTVIIRTSNAAADEIQQIIKQERALKASSAEVNEEELLAKEQQETEKGIKVYDDEYAGAIKFFESPITENFLVDIKDQLRVEFERSFRNLKEYDLEKK